MYPTKMPRPLPIAASSFLTIVLFMAAAIAQAQAPIVTNYVDMTFISIPAGSFIMGAGPGFQGDGEYERPAHEVIISKTFRLSRSEVTIEQWNRVMGGVKFYGEKKRDGKGQGPIYNVSWDDANEFVRRLNELEGTTKYRLPTEAEWEYAARGGTTTAYFFGDDPKQINDHAWCGGGFAKGTPQPVMGKKPNPFGLYDMLGNVSEWVSDWFSPNYYSQKIKRNPKGPPSGEEKVHRGGSYASDPKTCQSAWRETDLPSVESLIIGFRVAYDE